uniref:Uncharacterized protein n=1 Tax=Ascaris lumbricoides TaxID=6252 RepID=A0A0M3HKX0_ASCLU
MKIAIFNPTVAVVRVIKVTRMLINSILFPKISSIIEEYKLLLLNTRTSFQ